MIIYQRQGSTPWNVWIQFQFGKFSNFNLIINTIHFEFNSFCIQFQFGKFSIRNCQLLLMMSKNHEMKIFHIWMT